MTGNLWVSTHQNPGDVYNEMKANGYIDSDALKIGKTEEIGYKEVAIYQEKTTDRLLLVIKGNKSCQIATLSDETRAVLKALL